jgi:hypothetical protein
VIRDFRQLADRSSALTTDGQSVDAQVRQLTKAGCKKVFRETASGAKTDRPQSMTTRSSSQAARARGAGGRRSDAGAGGNGLRFRPSAGMGHVAADIVWAKLVALGKGARMASGRLF